MRLLHAESLTFKDFMGENVPPYAVLSHRWLEDTEQEVTLHDFKSGEAVHKLGYAKIQACARQAVTDKLSFIWVDTCCIDKTSSAELSEAINSMYLWYKNAQVCYVHLADVPTEDSPPSSSYPGPAFYKSDWFRRGWTLQELLAPSNVIFFAREWTVIGTKTALLHPIRSVTGINSRALTGANLSDFSIAQRMSWAALRVTTRIEDRAYSLLGLFDINMPLSYGEGKKAFIRLQEEIMKASDDKSIFAWQSADDDPELYAGLLALSPRDFQVCDHIDPPRLWTESEPCQMTSKGLRVKLRLSEYANEDGIYVAKLECGSGSTSGLFPAILLQLISVSSYGNHCVRVQTSRVMTADDTVDSKLCTVYVRQNISDLFSPTRFVRQPEMQEPLQCWWIRGTPDFQVLEPNSSKMWSRKDRTFLLSPGSVGMLLVYNFAPNEKQYKMDLIFGVVNNSPFCWLRDFKNLPVPGIPTDYGMSDELYFEETELSITAIVNQRRIYKMLVFTITLFVKSCQELMFESRSRGSAFGSRIHPERVVGH